jgi:hypothetical protein
MFVSAARFAGFGLLGAVVSAGACNSAKVSNDAGAPPTPESYPDTPLGRVAAIVVPRCGVGGCHDSASKTHDQDLSSLAKIVPNWVNVPGFDHCTGLETPRVIPGDPDASLVMMKLQGIAVCLDSDRMPPPPRAALTPEQIEVIRTWIAAGAPSDPATGDGGTEDSGASDAGDGAAPDSGEGTGCTASSPCGAELTCSADACSDEWQCIAHFDDTVEHPCDPEIMPFCGCDGVTFEASITCPDRPFAHPGACGDGESCYPGAVRCSDPAPVCPEGEAPSVIDDCYGPCIPIASCRCAAHYQCPNGALYTCLADLRCGPNFYMDAGTDAGP